MKGREKGGGGGVQEERGQWGRGARGQKGGQRGAKQRGAKGGKAGGSFEEVQEGEGTLGNPKGMPKKCRETEGNKPKRALSNPKEPKTTLRNEP